MAASMTPAKQIMEVLTNAERCLMEDLPHECPDLTWNQIFLELDRLSRSGEVMLQRSSAGEYVVTLKHEESAGVSTSHTTQGGLSDDCIDKVGTI